MGSSAKGKNERRNLSRSVPLNVYRKEIQAIKEKSFPSIKEKGTLRCRVA